LVKHAAEQQKYWQSLSPEDKARMLTKKADTERKRWKYLPPEKKVNMLETNAATHKKQCKSLSPDDGPEGRHNYLPQQQCASRRILLVRYELITSRSLC
jgi:hypothetical protein